MLNPAIASNTASTLRVSASSANSRSSICSRLCASDERSSLYPVTSAVSGAAGLTSSAS